MDALDRVAVVASPLLRDVDDALATLGAPADHPVWGCLRRLRTTPADAVAFFVGLSPDRLRSAHAAVRDQAVAVEAATVPASVPMGGSAADSYAISADALNRHLCGGADWSMAGRLHSTASFVDSVAGWSQRSRDRMARALATVLTSSQAVTLRSVRGLGRGLGEMSHTVSGRGLVMAAADVGAAVLGVAEDAVLEGRNLHLSLASELAELSYRPPAPADPATHQGTIRLQQ